jgi:hypothetical protein
MIYLFPALSDYNENNMIRYKILHSLESNKYVNVEPYTEEPGGILVYIHSSTDMNKNYLIFQWTMTFLELTWRIEHFFTVKSTDKGKKIIYIFLNNKKLH